MCGIALILTGARIIGSELYREQKSGAPSSISQEVYAPIPLIDDLKAALRRRGPDSLGSREIILQSKYTNFVEKEGEPVSAQDTVGDIAMRTDPEIELLGATLQLRGLSHVSQPLEDRHGNLLVYNGEIFGGIGVSHDENDVQALLGALEMCCSCRPHGLDLVEKAHCCSGNEEKSIPEILSTIRGPWAVIYWQKKSNTLWFGRDAFGRRSLVVHWPTSDDLRFVLSSVSPPSTLKRDSGSVAHGADYDVENMACKPVYWEELPCGIYSICLDASLGNEMCMKEKMLGEIVKHEWTDALLNRLIKWERTNVEPKAEELSLDSIVLRNDVKLQSGRENVSVVNSFTQPGCMHLAEIVLNALKDSVMRRTTINSIFNTPPDQNTELVPIALLFSGGLDSMILAALLDQCLDSIYAIDLLNVSFDGQLAPDRISARTGVKELQKIAPSRRWRLVEIDATLSDMTCETKHLMSLIHPSKTYMDLNIGIALWLAARGDGWVDGEVCHHLLEGSSRYKYKSSARVLFVGSGADEQCAGYGRHRTKYRHGGWKALQEEMRLDMQRIWKRNLGRDDRCMSDNGKEARFPFLDEDVIKTLLDIPLWDIANLEEPAGRGDKKILREVARLLGIEEAAVLPKRAIQFGSRIARESNRKTFGSNRAANQASAGSVEICETECITFAKE